MFYLYLQDNPCKHPVVILKDVNQDDVKALLNFVYQGTVYISEKKLASFLRTAELLQIRGLAGAASTINTDLVSTHNCLRLIIIIINCLFMILGINSNQFREKCCACVTAIVYQ